MDTIAINDGEAVHDLRHRLNLQKEENDLLIIQLDELKAIKDELEDVNNQNGIAIENATSENRNLRKALDEALLREEELTINKQQNEPKLNNAHFKIEELEAEIQDLTDDLHKIKNQNVLATNQAQSYKK